MSVRTIARAAQPRQGTTKWVNPTSEPVPIQLYGNNGPLPVQVVAPGKEVDLPSGYNRNMRHICAALVLASEVERPAAPPNAPPAEPAPSSKETRQQRRARERAEADAAKGAA